MALAPHRLERVLLGARRVPGAAAPLVLAVEIGGTTLRLGASRRGAPRTAQLSTPNYLDQPGRPAAELLADLLAQIAAGAARLDARTPDVLVVAWPGPIADGVALRSPTILGPEHDRRFDVRAAFEMWFPRARVYVLNDLTAAGYYFVDQGLEDFCVVTVGSGIGNKVFLRGEPVVGAHGRGGEIGHLRLTPAPGTPVAGQVADVGALASGRGTLWLAQAWDNAAPQPAAISAGESEAFAAAFRSGDAQAAAVVRAAAWPLAAALGALHLGIGLERFVILGGFAKALGERYREQLVALCRELTWDVGQDWNSMLSLGPDDVDEGLAGALHFGRRTGAVLTC